MANSDIITKDGVDYRRIVLAGGGEILIRIDPMPTEDVESAGPSVDDRISKLEVDNNILRQSLNASLDTVNELVDYLSQKGVL